MRARSALGGAALLALAPTLAACALLGVGRDPLVAAGAELYARHCAACHGAEARGDGPVAPALRVEPPDLTRIAARRGGRFPAGDVAERIDGRLQPAAHGLRTMPVWGHELADPLAPDAPGESVARGRVAELVAYLRSLQRAGS